MKGRSARTPACPPSRCTCRAAPIKSGCASRFATPSRKRRSSANCGRTRSIRSPARTRGDNLGPGTPIIHFDQWETGRHRSEAAAEGRRLREHEHSVLAADGAAEPRPRRSRPRRRRGSAFFTQSGTRRVRAARLAPSASASAATERPDISHAKEQLFRTLDDVNPDARLAELEAAIMGTVNYARHRHDGIWRQRQPDRLQDRRPQSAAGELLHIGRLRLLGVSAARCATRCARRIDHAVALPRSRQSGDSHDRSGRVHANRT